VGDQVISTASKTTTINPRESSSLKDARSKKPYLRNSYTVLSLENMRRNEEGWLVSTYGWFRLQQRIGKDVSLAQWKRKRHVVSLMEEESLAGSYSSLASLY